MQEQKTAAALLSVVSNASLVILKLIVGLAIGSVSVLSEAIHSGVDLLAAVIALFAVKRSGEPADREHPFGHGKFENVSGTIEAALIFAAGGWIIYEAIHRLIHPGAGLERTEWGVAVMLASCALNFGVSHLLFRVGKATDSPALQADGWHLRTDVWTSAGVMAGLAVIWISESLMPGRHFHWIDPLAAILVALMIVRAAWRLTIESGRDLLDVNLPPEEEAWIEDCVRARGAGVHGLRRLRTRKSGATRFFEFELVVDPKLTVEESHWQAEAISQAVIGRFPGADVTIHVEPYRAPRG